ncbi:FtsX-like permease family protein [Kordiimonas sp.]|uniref:FtsX-like permease family protein n=1 Tax=Kordiimonas sp. TaxID=1970157 RepID=UPI003A914B27
MFRNYMMTAIRNLMRYKQYTFINTMGLAVGLAACLLILLYVNFELSYDRWIPENDRVMRIETNHYAESGEIHYRGETIPPVVASVLADEFDEIELYARFLTERVALAIDGKAFEQEITLSDPGVFELMGIRLLEGDAATALDKPDSIVLSETDARRIFGEGPVVGKTVKLDGQYLKSVTGVMPDWPAASDLEVSAIIPISSDLLDYRPWVREEWGSFWGPTYVRLKQGTDVQDLSRRFNEYVRRVGPSDRFQDRIDQGMPPEYEFHMTRAMDAHLMSEVGGSDSRGSLANLWSAGVIALLILCIAIINVTNLGTMLAMKRVREIAIRKALGAEARHLMVQVLVESVSLTFISMLIGIALAEMLLPTFSQLMNRELSTSLIYGPEMMLGLLGGTLLVGVICGLYPAMVAVKFRPVDYLSGIKPSLGVRFRNTLIVLQFAATIGLLATCVVVFMQAEYARSQSKGFDSAQVISVDGIERPLVLERQEALRDAFSRIDGVEAVAASHGMPGHNYNNNNNLRVDTGNEVVTRRFAVSTELLPLLGVKPIAGRLFSKDFPSDAETEPKKGASRAIVLNDIAARELGFKSPEDAVGHDAYTWGEYRSTIIGVVENLRTRSAHSKPSATYFWIGPREYRHIVMRVSPVNMPQTLAAIDRTWREFFPELPIRRQFADDAFAEYYDAERRQGWLLLFSAGVMVFIAVMGLYGLAALATERRSKEIGIRKVLGARTGNIVQLLLWQFSLPVIIANVIAWPIAWWSLNQWLESFVDRVSLTPLPFLAAGLGVLLVAWVTIIGHTLKVARSNPIKALRYE